MFIIFLSCTESSNKGSSNQNIIKRDNSSDKKYVKECFNFNPEEKFEEIFLALQAQVKPKVKGDNMPFLNILATKRVAEFKSSLFKLNGLMDFKDSIDLVILGQNEKSKARIQDLDNSKKESIDKKEKEINDSLAILISLKSEIKDIFNKYNDKNDSALFLKFYTLWRLFLGDEKEIVEVSKRVLAEDLGYEYNGLDNSKNGYLINITFALIEKGFNLKDKFHLLGERKNVKKYVNINYSKEILVALNTKDEAIKTNAINNALYIFKVELEEEIKSVDDQNANKLVLKYICLVAFIFTILD